MMTSPSNGPGASADFDLTHYLAAKREVVNQTLEVMLGAPSAEDKLACAMKYSIMAGGKRLRPVLCLAAAETVGGNPYDALPTACALEMIHTYSLIHDDLPAMDDDQLRRGRPTCHVAFDEATAILAGDALLTLAFEQLAANANRRHVSAPKRLDIIRIVAAAAGCRGMIEGQMQDMTSEGGRLPMASLEKMHLLKTGALIRAAVKCGAILGNGSQTQIDRLDRYARSIGLAFQVTDDILNVEGDPALMGKAVGTDQHRSKTTYPALLGMAESKGLAQKLVSRALQALDIFDNRSEPLRAIAAYVVERKR